MKVVSDRQVVEHLLATLNKESIVNDYQPALLSALSNYEKDPSVSPERTVQLSNTPGSDTTHLFMPCIAPHGVGVKVVSGGPTNGSKGLGFQGCAVILDEYTGELLAIVNAKALTAFRTALASTFGLIKVFDVKESGVMLPELLVFGTGPQAFWHAVLAGRLYPQIKRINVVSRTLKSGENLAAELAQVLHQDVVALELTDKEQVRTHVRNSSIIFGCTPSTEGIILGDYIDDDPNKRKYISLIGSYKPHMIELNLEFIKQHFTGKKTKILVDSKSNTLSEAGELIQGEIGKDQLASLLELMTGEVDIGDCITETGVVVLKIVGLLIMDIAMAKFVMENCEGLVVNEF
ncbi:CIC11C00000000005 [Sungouiella intermedia]|uniref:CIC11C00000000005 n=1 Tax=Sungouiella intermedia TaxID=45354 RepID=A0A1L0D8K8_9ASCO|nr:CIC11C00000000005 [[Candida] intermedia]